MCVFVHVCDRNVGPFLTESLFCFANERLIIMDRGGLRLID